MDVSWWRDDVHIIGLGGEMTCILSVYAPQTGRTQEDKDAFRNNLEEIIGHVEPETMLVVAGDLNAHVGKRQ